MKFSVGRLVAANGWERLKVGIHSRVDDTFKNFGDEVEVRDRAIIGEIVRREVIFLEKWSDNGFLE